MEKTCDEFVFIEEKREGYVRYYCPVENKRWEVYGVCIGIGKCWEGAMNPKPELDCPVRIGFQNNCCDLKIVELN